MLIVMKRRTFLQTVPAGLAATAPGAAEIPKRRGVPSQITDIKIHEPAGLLRIITNAGLEGWCLDVSEDTARLIQAQYRSALIGRDPLLRERIWQELVRLDRLQPRIPPVRAYLDVALWDLGGKALGLPVYQLIGGFRGRIPACRTGNPLPTVEAVVGDALAARSEGFLGYKQRGYADVKETARLAKAVRRAVGPDFYLMHDGGQQYDHDGALRVGKALQEQAYYWLEEPLQNADILGLKQLAGTLDIPVAAAVKNPDGLHAASQLLALQAADIVQASVPLLGGITDALKLARLAEAFLVHCEFKQSDWTGGFVLAHLLGAFKNCAFYETSRAGSQGGGPLIKNPLMLDKGHLPVPGSPGLGIELDWQQVERQTAHVI